MADRLYHVDDLTLQNLPRHLRNAAAMAPRITIRLAPHPALQLARIIEEHADAPVRVVEVARPRSRFEWYFWALMLATAVEDLIDGPSGVLAAYFTGLLHG